MMFTCLYFSKEFTLQTLRTQSKKVHNDTNTCEKGESAAPQLSLYIKMACRSFCPYCEGFGRHVMSHQSTVKTPKCLKIIREHLHED